MGSPTQGWSPEGGRERIGLLLVVVKWYMVAMFMVPILVLLDTAPALASPVSGPCGGRMPPAEEAVPSNRRHPFPGAMDGPLLQASVGLCSKP